MAAAMAKTKPHIGMVILSTVGGGSDLVVVEGFAKDLVEGSDLTALGGVGIVGFVDGEEHSRRHDHHADSRPPALQGLPHGTF
jgi:hypothetical protein